MLRRHNQKKAQRSGTAVRALVAATVAAALGAGGAFAQVYQVQQGNIMDANPQVGTGGANQGVQGYVPVNGNDVMTGNVSGLMYFHGQVGRPGNQTGLGTFSPYEFSGNQGSAALNNFARLTAGSQVSGAVNQAYYLPSQTVSTAKGSLYSSPINGGFESALIPASAISPTATGAQISAISQAAQQSVDPYGAINRALPEPVYPGTPGGLLEDPLYWERTKAELAAIQTAAQQQLMAPPGAATQPAATMPETEGTTTQPENPAEVQGTVGEGVGMPITGEPANLKNANNSDKTVNAQVSDLYAKLVLSLNEAAGSKSNLTGTGAQTQPGAQEATEPTGAPTEIDPLTGQPRNILMAGTGIRSGGGAGGMGTGMAAGGTGAGGAGQQTGGNGSAGTSSLTAKRFDSVTDSQLQAGARLKPVKLGNSEDLTGLGGVAPFDAMMSRGDADLRSGKYLDAAQAFQAAMVDKPQDPLAVVGRAHAEMGAGMYTSAAFDLKFVFTRKPELMSVKYDVGSFIPAGRQAFLLQDLKKLTADKDAGGMAAFLYCYLCYQTGRTDLLQAELKDWGTLPGNDQWRAVAQRAWGTSTPQEK